MKTKMAFLSIHWADGVISLDTRENACLIRCEWNLGSNSTQETLPVSSFCAMVVWAIMCDWAMVSRHCRRLRSSKLEGSSQG